MRELFERWYLTVTKGNPKNLEKDAAGRYIFVGQQYLAFEAGNQIAADELTQRAKVKEPGQERSKDAARLDFVLENWAFIVWDTTELGVKVCQLMTQDEDEHYVPLHGATQFFKTPREAIDAAMPQPAAITEPGHGEPS